MKLFSKCLLMIASFTFKSMENLYAQISDGWDFGISAGYGKDLYNRRYHVPEKVPGGIEKFQSAYSLGAGIWGEKHLNPSISILTKLNFNSQKLPNNTLCECNVSAAWYQYERQYWGSLGAGIRGYLRSKSSMKLFAETGFQGDWFLGYTEAINHQKKYYANAAGYQRFAPGVNVAIGLQWKRIGLLGEYQTNIARTFHQDADVRSGLTYGMKKSILREGFMVKFALRIF